MCSSQVPDASSAHRIPSPLLYSDPPGVHPEEQRDQRQQHELSKSTSSNHITSNDVSYFLQLLFKLDSLLD